MMQASASEDRQMLEHLETSPTLRVLTNTEELERIAMRILPDTPSPVVNTDPSGAFQWQPHPDQMRSRAAAGSDAGTSYTMGDGLRGTTQPLRLGDEQAAGSEEDRMLRHLAGTWPSSHAESKRYTAHLEGQGGANLAPGKLKRPRCAYLVYLDRHRPRVRAENPSMQMKEMVILLAKEWKTVSKEEEQLCRRIEKLEKEQYQELLYSMPSPARVRQDGEAVEAEPEVKKRRRVKGADEPKKGRTAYVLFMMDYRAALKANPTQQPQAAETQAATLANFATVSKQVSEAWKRMDAAARAPYLQRQQAEMAEYKKKMSAYTKAQKQQPDDSSARPSSTTAAAAAAGLPASVADATTTEAASSLQASLANLVVSPSAAHVAAPCAPPVVRRLQRAAPLPYTGFNSYWGKRRVERPADAAAAASDEAALSVPVCELLQLAFAGPVPVKTQPPPVPAVAEPSHRNQLIWEESAPGTGGTSWYSSTFTPVTPTVDGAPLGRRISL